MSAAGYEVVPFRTSFLNMINYCYLIVDTASRQAALVDPAWEPGTLVQALEERGLRLGAIVLTHAHFDHVHLADELASRYQAPVYMSRQEIDAYAFACCGLTALADGESVTLGATELKAWLTPGHTAGSMCYVLEDDVFTGDTLFAEGCGKCTGQGGDAAHMFASLQRLKTALAPHMRIFPGHSYGQPPGTTFGELLKSNAYLQFSDAERFIRFRMRANQQAVPFR